MRAQRETQNTSVITGMFANTTEAENAYHLLMELGYAPHEVTLIMSEKLSEALLGRTNGRKTLRIHQDLECCPEISDAITAHGTCVAIPGCKIVVTGDFSDGSARAISESVLSDDYAEFYQSRLEEGEIIIDFVAHSARDKRLVRKMWADCDCLPIVRHAGHAA